MRIIKIISALIVTLVAALPSAGEIKFPAPDDLIETIGNYSYPKNAESSRFMIIRGESLEYLASIPLDRYRNLEAVVIEFTEDPAAEDAKKEKAISTVEKNLHHLINLRKSRNLKYLVLHTGEFLFIRAADALPYKSIDPAVKVSADRINLERLNKRFGKKLEELLPGVTVYGHNWGW